MTTIGTHLRPDLDAITSVWLLRRYVPELRDATVRYVNTAQSAREVLRTADAVVDTGGELDGEQWRFDHHQLPGTTSAATCAARLVWDYLNARGAAVNHLAPLIDLVHAGDSGTASARISYEVGIHALVNAYGRRGASDDAVLDYGCALLDLVAEHLHRHANARWQLADAVRYRANDGRLVAVEGNRDLTDAALDNGAAVVVFLERAPRHRSIAVGLVRAGDECVDVGALVADVVCTDTAPWDVRRELRRWFRHPAGFFAGRGTSKAPDPRELAAPFEAIAAALDAAWHREQACRGQARS